MKKGRRLHSMWSQSARLCPLIDVLLHHAARRLFTNPLQGMQKTVHSDTSIEMFWQDLPD